MRSHHYIQVISDVTRHGNNITTPSLIDLIWINQLSAFNSAIIKTGITDHYTIYIQIPFVCIKKPVEKIKITFRDCSDSYHEVFQNNLENFDWVSLRNNDVDTYTYNFISALNNIFQTSFPLRTKVVTTKYFSNPWHNSELKRLTDARVKYHNLYKQGHVTLHEYSQFRNKVTSIIRKCKVKYYERCFLKHAGNMKKSWELIRKLCYGTSNNNSVQSIRIEDDIINCPQIIADKFNHYFVNIANELENNLPHSDNSPYQFVKRNNNLLTNFESVTSTEISDAIKLLKNTKQGVDSISVVLFKKFSNIFLSTICELVNLSFTTGIFPEYCKQAIVRPLHKKGAADDIRNFRPLTLLPFLSKIFEQCIYTRLFKHAVLHNIFPDQQYGFIKGRSTQDALISLTNNIYDCFNEEGCFCLNVFIDFQKCFDTIDHEILLGKLALYGITGSALNLIENYFRGRKQSVRIGDIISSPLPITKGTFQGTKLSPIFCLYFLADMSHISDVFKPVLYADDTTLSFKFSSISEANRVCNMELAKFFQWTASNKMSINYGRDKSFFMLHTYRNLDEGAINLSINNHKIEKLDIAKFLGVFIDSKLKFDHHINYIADKISKSNGIIYKLSQLKLPSNVLIQLYYNLIYSYLNYNIICYAATYDSHTNRLFLLQKKAIRNITHSDYLAHTDPLFHSNNILKFHDIYKLNAGMYAYSNQHLFERSHIYNTRNTYDLLPVRARIRVCEFSLSVAAPRIFNSIPLEIQSVETRNAFKCRYKKHLLSSYIQ